MRKSLILLTLVFLSLKSFAITVMNGASDTREACVWLQGDASAQYSLSYTGEKSKHLLKQTTDESGIVKFILSDLAPSSAYEYKISEPNTESEFKSFVKTAPDIELRSPAPDFSVAILGKNHNNDAVYDEPFKTPGAEYEIYNVVKEKSPIAVVWANNVANFRPADWGSKSGMQARYKYERSHEKLQGLLASSSHYGVIGTGSYGAPNSDKRLWNKADSLDVFADYWTNVKSSFSSKENAATFFRYADAEFFILDDVSQRNDLILGTSIKEFFGKEQLEWLMVSLKNSRAKFKIVISNSPVVNPVENPSNYAYAKAERKELLDFLLSEKIGGVVFASANKNYGEITKLVRGNASELVEVTAGPLTARPATKPEELNYFRLTSSAVLKRSFVLLSFKGPENARTIEIEFIDSKGKSVFAYKLTTDYLYEFR